LQGLSQYGNGFLAKFEAAACPNQLLEEVTLVDTPGVLSGEKQRIEVLCLTCLFLIKTQ
jgi:EH domain-containing protein 1